MFVCLPGVRHVTPPLTLPPYRSAIRLLSYDFASLEENLLYRSETNTKGGARKRSQFNLNFHISSSPRQRLSPSVLFVFVFIALLQPGKHTARAKKQPVAQSQVQTASYGHSGGQTEPDSSDQAASLRACLFPFVAELLLLPQGRPTKEIRSTPEKRRG